MKHRPTKMENGDSVKLTLAYKGTKFNGWQTQPKGRTVQDVLSKSVATLLNENVDVLGASRTDSGVHANGQVACLKYSGCLGDKVKEVVNRVLPEDLVILEAERVSDSFHPIIDTTSKIYRYKIDNHPLRSPFEHDLKWHVRGGLNLDRMREAAKYLVGEHDYKTFCASGSNVTSTVRTVYSIEIHGDSGAEIELVFHGNGFLYNMVRIMTAMIVRVGEGKLKPSDLKLVLEAEDRSRAPWTAPSHGLYLEHIYYDDESKIQKEKMKSYPQKSLDLNAKGI